MRVVVYPADTGGCGFYRLRWPSALLTDQGVEVHDAFPEGQRRRYTDRHGLVTADRLHAVPALDGVDVVVFQRPLQDSICEAIPVIQGQGTAVVVELDDDFHALPAGHPGKRDTSAGFDPRNNRRWLRKACELADLVTCSTPAIAARYAPHGRFRVLPNCVPARYLTIQKVPHDGPPVVGWTGSTVTHVRDLEVTGGGVAQACRDTGARFHVVGTGHGVRSELGFGEGEPITASGWVELDNYPAAYAGLDVAVVPLQPNPFNEAKSWLKGIEAAALGVPFVASATSPYIALAEAGMGWLALNPFEWREKVGRLASDPALRSELGGQYRSAAADWTIEGNAWRWLEAWTDAAHARQGSVAA